MDTDRPMEPSTTPKRLISRTLDRHRVGLFAVWLVGSLAVAGFILTQIHPVYRVNSIVRIDPASTPLLGVTTSNESLEMFLQTQVQLITSPNVLTAAGTNPKVAPLPRIQAAGDVVQELKKVVNVNIIPGTYLIEVSMIGPDADESTRIVNAVVDAYLNVQDEWAEGMSRPQIKRLEDYQAELALKVQEIELRWKEIVTNGGDAARPRDPRNPGDAALRIEQFKRLTNNLFDLHLELVQAEAWATALKDDASKRGGEADHVRIERIIERKFQSDPDVMALASQLQAAQEKLDAATRLGGPTNDPVIAQARKNLDALKSKYNDLWAAKSTAFRDEIELTSVIRSAQQELREAERKVLELKVKEEALKAEAEKARVAAVNQTSDEVAIIALRDQRESFKGMEEAVHRRLEQLRFDAKGGTRVRKVSEAGRSGKPFADQRGALMLLTPFAMAFVAFGLFLGLEAVKGPKPGPVVATQSPSRPKRAERRALNQTLKGSRPLPNDAPRLLAIFDHDGVLVDSLELHQRAWVELGARANLPVTANFIHETFGMANPSIFRKLLGDSIRPDQIAHYTDLKETCYRDLARGQIALMDGVLELLDRLKAAGFSIAIGTSGVLANSQLTIDETGLQGRFAAISSAEDFTHGKPDPEVFLVAAHKVGIEPRHAVVFEDAVYGIQAAKAAGMYAVGVTTTSPAAALYEAGADQVVETLRGFDVEALTRALRIA